MKLTDCHNFYDFRKLAKKKLPSPIFHYIDGAADDEITYEISNNSEIGMSYNHISNASLGDKNPGANSYMINFIKKY